MLCAGKSFCPVQGHVQISHDTTPQASRRRNLLDMVFSSLTFICVFLPLVVAFYFALPKAANNLILVVASYVFYAWGDPAALLLIAPSVAMNFQFGRFIDSASGVRRRQFVPAAVAINLTILVVFKYSDFILENLN